MEELPIGAEPAATCCTERVLAPKILDVLANRGDFRTVPLRRDDASMRCRAVLRDHRGPRDGRLQTLAHGEQALRRQHLVMERGFVRVLEARVPATEHQVFERNDVEQLGQQIAPPFRLLGRHPDAWGEAAQHQRDPCEQGRRHRAMCTNHENA